MKVRHAVIRICFYSYGDVTSVLVIFSFFFFFFFSAEGIDHNMSRG